MSIPKVPTFLLSGNFSTSKSGNYLYIENYKIHQKAAGAEKQVSAGRTYEFPAPAKLAEIVTKINAYIDIGSTDELSLEEKENFNKNISVINSKIDSYNKNSIIGRILSFIGIDLIKKISLLELPKSEHVESRPSSQSLPFEVEGAYCTENSAWNEGANRLISGLNSLESNANPTPVYLNIESLRKNTPDIEFVRIGDTLYVRKTEDMKSPVLLNGNSLTTSLRALDVGVTHEFSNAAHVKALELTLVH